jgi:hypothetical protein
MNELTSPICQVRQKDVRAFFLVRYGTTYFYRAWNKIYAPQHLDRCSYASRGAY